MASVCETTLYSSLLLRILYIIYIVLIAAPIYAVVTIVLALIMTVGCLLGFGKFFSYYPGLIWSWLGLILSLCPVTVRGRKNYDKKSGPYVVMANHQGAYDIFLLYGFLGIPFKWVMKESLRRVPFVGKACAVAGFIFVNGHSIQNIRNSLDEAKRSLGDGYSIFIFPEGSRTRTGRMQPFKKGGFVIADELDIPIIPVSISGSYGVMRAGSLLPHWRRLYLDIHPPVHPREFHTSDQPIQDLREQVYHTIQQGIHDGTERL